LHGDFIITKRRISVFFGRPSFLHSVYGAVNFMQECSLLRYILKACDGGKREVKAQGIFFLFKDISRSK